MIVLLLASLASAANPAAGKAIYAANCTACHGAAGDGKGPAAVALKPRPPDFTAQAWQTSRSDAQLTSAIRAGRPGTPMVAYTQLSDADVQNVVAYIRSLRK